MQRNYSRKSVPLLHPAMMSPIVKIWDVINPNQLILCIPALLSTFQILQAHSCQPTGHSIENLNIYAYMLQTSENKQKTYTVRAASIWRFPKMVIPLNHPFIDGCSMIFQYKPTSYWGSPFDPEAPTSRA